MFDWMLLWTAVMGVVAVITVLGTLFGFIRKNDLKLNTQRHDMIDQRINELTTDVNNKLNEAEFRRFETRHEAALLSIKESTDNRIDKLELKLDEKFDRLFDMLMKK
jgi:hypothetical protein